MSLDKQTINMTFLQGLDTRTDPYQIPLGNFQSIQNTIFNKDKLMQKRNGFGYLTAPSGGATKATTFNSNLTLIGDRLQAYSQGSETWVDKGPIQPVHVSTQSLLKRASNVIQPDSAIAPNGLVCTVFTEIPQNTSIVYKYTITDTATGQSIINSTLIPLGTGTGPTIPAPRVFVLGNYFIIVLENNVSGTPHLQYVTINITDPTKVGPNVDISTDITNRFDGVVVNSKLYLAWNGSTSIHVTSIDAMLNVATPASFAGEQGSQISVCADETLSSPVIYVNYVIPPGARILAVNQILATVLAPTTSITTGDDIEAITASAQNGICSVFYSIAQISSIFLIETVNVTQAGVPTAPVIITRQVGLASKSFIIDGKIYMFSTHHSPFQNSYFLIDSAGHVLSRVAYGNGGGNIASTLPSANVIGTKAYISYIFKEQTTPVTKTNGANNTGLYFTPSGINLGIFDITDVNVQTSEIGNDLHLSGGILWMYDGVTPVEHNFLLWPETVGATWNSASGSMSAQPDGATNTNAYYYQVTYEWNDNVGNTHRSAPSIPLGVTTSGSGNMGSVTLTLPTIAQTYKINNPITLHVYRWSVAQQVYHEVTLVNKAPFNNVNVDSITFIDTLSDEDIAGNLDIYTTGGVIENIAAPPTNIMALYKSRLVLVDAEDTNLLWYSKQVIEATPVEMSDLFTIFVAPTTGAQGDTGPITALSAMDDKLIIFKKDAIYYLTGNGPDNTGANNDFSEPVFITSTIGCVTPDSIVFIPQGLMFQSDKGIWLLGRDLSTLYIGAPVQQYNDVTVLSSLNIPGTNEVRLTLDNGLTLMYDYFAKQWGTFSNIPAISSTLYQSLHTYVDTFGRVLQQTPGKYLDGTRPTTLSFTTGWINLGGLQGFQRAYYFYLLGTYLSPHTLTVSIAYDYNSSPTQVTVINPINYSGPYGSDPLYGSSSTPYGGPSQIEQWRVFLQTQKCQSFQITIQESYDPSLGIPAGAGLTLSGIDLIVGIKDGKPRLPATQYVG